MFPFRSSAYQSRSLRSPPVNQLIRKCGKNNHFTEMCCGTEAGSYLRLIDSCVTQLKVQGPSTTCNESKEEEDVLAGGMERRFLGGENRAVNHCAGRWERGRWVGGWAGQRLATYACGGTGAADAAIERGGGKIQRPHSTLFNQNRFLVFNLNWNWRHYPRISGDEGGAYACGGAGAGSRGAACHPGGNPGANR